jgi:hypothetical protein
LMTAVPVGVQRHRCCMGTTKDEVIRALDAVESGYRVLTGLPLEALSRSDTYGLLARLEAIDKASAALSRRVIGRLIAEAEPATALSRRLRISTAEAQRRIAEAERPSA